MRSGIELSALSGHLVRPEALFWKEEPVVIKDALGLEMRLPQEWSLTPPKVGDVWVVSSSGVDEGIVLISAVRDGYVLAWPVTSCNENAGYPCKCRLPYRLAGSGVRAV